MGVPGDIVSALLQGYGARRAGLGVTTLGERGGCLEPKGAAGYTREEGQPRASAQRGAHGPGTDLEPGRDQGQGCPLAKPGPARQHGAGPEPRQSSWRAWGAQGASLRPSSEATCLVAVLQASPRKA